VKGVALWTLGTVVAFLTTAVAFLLLANLGGPAASDLIPQAKPSNTQGSESPLVLELSEDRLEGLERRSGQRLVLGVENEGDEELSSVDLALDITSENTAQPRTRSYRETLEQLAPNESTNIEFEIDLSPPLPLEANYASTDPQAREILEIRATTSEGASAVKTAVLVP
jgi:hypothetical protein